MDIIYSSLLLVIAFTIQCGYVFSDMNIRLNAPTQVRYEVDKLSLSCYPENVIETDSISSIILQKHSASRWTNVVTVEEGTEQHYVTWIDTDMQGRANDIMFVVAPVTTARLQIEINASRVACDDGGVYRCGIIGKTSSGDKWNSHSELKNVMIKVEPVSIDQIVLTPLQEANTYNPQSQLTLTCTGDVGNPPSALRWCVKRSGMHWGYVGYPDRSDITEGAATISDCQYRRTSILSYTVSDYIEQIDFRCETGGISNICGHTSSIASHVTVYKCQMSCPSYIQIYATSDVRYNVDNLVISCDPANVTNSDLISSIILQKKSNTGWKNVVQMKRATSLRNEDHHVTWMDTDMPGRATFTATLSPSTTAGLQIELTADNVTCSDEGVYRCQINGKTASGLSLNSLTSPSEIKVNVHPQNIDLILVNQSQTEKIYNPNTTLTLKCSADVGNPPGDLKWYMKSECIDTNFTEYPDVGDITEETTSLAGCHYRRTSVLSYNVSSSLQNVNIKCETSCINITGGYTPVSAEITIFKSTSITTCSGLSLSEGKLSLLAYSLLSILAYCFGL